MSRKTHRFAYLTLFVAIEIVISVVPFLGFIPLGIINATTLHIPVILAGIILGKKEGAIVGFVFGLCSLLRSTFEPNITSFLFSPFYTLGSISGNAMSLVIAFIPRILVGYSSGLIYEVLKKKVDDGLSVMISSFIASFVCNTVLVMMMAYLFFAEAYAEALGIAIEAVFGAILAIISINGLIEAIVAVVIVLAAYKASRYIVKGV